MDSLGGWTDLHIHSYYSDGTYSPYEILELAAHNNVAFASITDHDLTQGSREFCQLAKDFGIASIPGIEIEADFNDATCHILGYGFDYDNQSLLDLIQKNLQLLMDSDKSALENISFEFNSDISNYDDFTYPKQNGGRKLHNYLIYFGYAQNMDEARDLIMKNKSKTTFAEIQDVISTIHKSGGIAVLAHPGTTFKHILNLDDLFDNYINTLVSHGIDGIECFYPNHTGALEQKIIEYCIKNNLYYTVGSDFHGDFFRHVKQKIGCEFKTLNDIHIPTCLI